MIKAILILILVTFFQGYLIAHEINANTQEKSVELNSEHLTSKDIASLLEKIISSEGQRPTFEELLATSNNANTKFIKDGYFVLAVFTSAINQKPEMGIDALKTHEVNQTYLDNLNNLKEPENLMEESYSWLVNHAVIKVPSILARKYPELLHMKTPFWWASGDRYFSVQIPDKWQKTLQHPNLQDWRKLLDDIESPSKDFFHGTMRAGKFKLEWIYTGLLANNQGYFSRLENIEPDQWMQYWSLQGAYEYSTFNRYMLAKENAVDHLAESLVINEKVNKNKAMELAENYTNLIENTFVYHDRYVREYNALIQTLTIDGWQAIVKDQELLDRWNHSGKLKTVGGHLLFNNTDNFVPYLEWLYSKQYFAIVSELIGLSMVIDGDYYKLINLMRVKPTQWGGFNKTPLMYAAHYDKYDALKFLFESFPSMIDEETVAGEKYDYEMPKIGGRTVLTYALENASYKTIEMVIKNTPSFMHKNKDSADRDAMYYLSLNTEISLYEKEKIVKLLLEKA